MLATVLSLIEQALQLIGAALIVWGLARLGLAIQQQQGGQAMAEAFGTIGGGAVVMAAGAFFTRYVSNYGIDNV